LKFIRKYENSTLKTSHCHRLSLKFSHVGITMKTSDNNNAGSTMAVNDINDVFEQILLSEERISEESYKQGFSKGVSDGNLEAYHLG
jgi:hypothetical protein